jgi:nucleotide-binding universal stress UspA family protein
MNHPSNETKRHVLAVANETAKDEKLHETLRHLGASADVLVISPAFNSRLRHWLSDDDGARRAAARRLETCVRRLRRAGVDATGGIGDADPMQAIQDALRVFPADEIVIATHPEGRSNWLARDLVDRARSSFWQPVLHVVADAENLDRDPQVQRAA